MVYENDVKTDNKPKTVMDEEPYVLDEREQEIVSYIKEFKNGYRDSKEFREWQKRAEKIKNLVDQEWKEGEQKTKFGFKLGATRAAHDNIIDSLEDVTDVDDWVRYTPKTKDDPELQEVADNFEDFTNNMLDSIGYTDLIQERFSYIPFYGWSISYAEFKYNEGYTMKPQADTQEANGIVWNREMDTILSEPCPRVIHPYNWFGTLAEPLRSQTAQGFTMRWYARDIVQAMAQVDGEGRPLYNQKAMKYALKVLKKGKCEADDTYFDTSENNLGFGSGEVHQSRQGNYIDVNLFIGPLYGVEGFYDDPNSYIIVCSNRLLFRKKEHPIDGYTPFNHMQPYPRVRCPIPRTPMDVIIPHGRINDLMVNFGIENTIDGMQRMWMFKESSFINPEAFKFPKGLNTILYMVTAENVTEPKLVENRNDTMRGDYESLQKTLDWDKQRSGAGATDMEAGIQGKNQKKTATEAQAIFANINKRIRAMVKRMMRRAVVPDVKYLTLLALQHYEPEQLKFLNRKGDEIVITAEMAGLFLKNMILRVNDNITRNKALDAVNNMEFFSLALKVLPMLQQPEYTIKALRRLARDKDIRGTDDFIPDVQTPVVPDAEEGGPGPGSGSAPGAAPQAQAQAPEWQGAPMERMNAIAGGGMPQ